MILLSARRKPRLSPHDASPASTVPGLRTKPIIPIRLPGRLAKLRGAARAASYKAYVSAGTTS